MELFTFYIILFSLVSFSQQTPNYRLPNDSVPISYELNFEIDMINYGTVLFNGRAKIFLEILKPTVNLTMHAYKLDFNEEKTKLVFGEETFAPEKHIFENKSEFLILNFREYLKPGRYNLSLEYSGEVSSSYETRGIFYQFSFDIGEQKIEYVVATHFEPNFAHRVFPCWDEPALKATFDISIKHLSNYTALSNMPVKKETNTTVIDGEKLTCFERTPLMSTYLVAFTLSRFVNVTNPQGNISLWVSKEFSNDSREASYETILKAFPVLENYTNIQYFLPKMDIIGLPRLTFGAMENWGLITISKELLETSIRSYPRSAWNSIIAIHHEIVHQWFGNLVSPNWWSDVWITEGLTTYFDSHLFSKAMNDPTIMDWTFFNGHFMAANDHFQHNSALGKDVKVLSKVFDLLLYSHNRGSGVMRMLNGLISEEVFNRGIRTLLDQYKFKSISTDDFWKIMQENLNQSQVPHFDIKERIEPFVLNLGLPLINVERNYKTGEVKLTQGCLHKNSTCQSKRWIPINYATSSSFNFSSTQATLWMDPSENETIIHGIDPNDLVIFNIQGIAPYIVNYGNKDWRKIADYLKSNNFHNIHRLNRAKLLVDAQWSFAQKKINRTLYKSLLSYLKNEREFMPWVIADYIFQSWRHEKEFLLEIATPLLNDNSTSGDNIFARYKKQIAIDLTISNGFQIQNHIDDYNYN